MSVVSQVFDASTLVEHAESYGGATVKVITTGFYVNLEIIQPYGYMVAMPGSINPLGRLYAGRIASFVAVHPLIGQGITYLGIWYDDEADNDRPWWIEESMWFEHYPHAMNYARYWGQRYIWNINGKNKLEVND